MRPDQRPERPKRPKRKPYVEPLVINRSAANALLAYLGQHGIDTAEMVYDVKPDGRVKLMVSEEFRAEVDSYVVRNRISFSEAVKVAVSVRRLLGLAPLLLLFLVGACSAPLPVEPAEPAAPVSAAVDTLPWFLTDSLSVWEGE